MNATRFARRRGATVLEMSFILSTFLVLTLGMLDLGVGVFRYHVISQAARYTARRAIVHGDQASVLGAWGPTAISSLANATGIPAIDGTDDGVGSKLIGCDLTRTQVNIDWLDGDNAVDSRVRVTITSPYRPSLLFIFSGEIILSATSTMTIAH